MKPTLSVNRTVCKLRLQVLSFASGFGGPVTHMTFRRSNRARLGPLTGAAPDDPRDEDEWPL